jgi:hypothetical protein
MHDAAVFRDGRVKRDDLDATRSGLFTNGYKRIRIIGRNDDAVDLLRNERIDNGNLIFRRCLGWCGIDNFKTTDFSSGLFCTIGASIKIGVTKILHNHCNALVISASAGDEGHR